MVSKHLEPLRPSLLWLALVGSGCVAPPDGELTGEPEPSSSSATPDPSTSGGETDASPSTGATAADTEDTDTGCEPGECPGDETDEVCPLDVDARSGLFGLGIRHTRTASDAECFDACTTPRTIVYSIDPASGGSTVLALGGLGTVPHAFAIADDGSFVVAGELAPLWFEPGEAAIERLAPTGETLWSVVLPDDNVVEDVVLRGDEVVTINSGRLAAYSLADGSPLWDVEGPSLQRVELDAMGNVYAAGEDDGQLLVRKLDATQTQLWEVVGPAGAGTSAQLTAMAVDETGGVITAVRSWTNDTVDDKAVVLRKLDADGLEAWTHVIDEGGPAPGAADDYVFDLVPYPGGVVAVGQAAIDGGLASATAFDVDGNAQWSETQAHPKTPNATYVGAALEAGDVLAVGCATQPELPYERYRWVTSYTP